ncbi:MAG TPA: amidohydrolase family protein [Burkholderiaceae bacterium]
MRIEASLSRRAWLTGAAAGVALTALGLPQEVQAQPASGLIVLRGARIFDGQGARLIEGRDVLVRGNRIEALLEAGTPVTEARSLDCHGGTLTPGLIDAHWHSLLAAIPQLVALTADVPYVHLVAAQEAGRTLLRGFTTVRDVGGPAFALKRAIDEGGVAGPRIYPSGAMISQTSGHGDFRQRSDLPRTSRNDLSAAEAAGISAIADGEAEVLRRVREQLMLGASQIKIMAGGGVASAYDPIDALQYSESEMRAAVSAATDWGTYVCAHVYTADGIRRALACGVRSIEHGQLADEDAVRRMVDAGAWWSLQPFLADEDANVYASEAQRLQQQRIAEGTVHAFEWRHKHGVKIAFGTDILFNPKGTAGQGRQLAKLARWFDPVDVMRLATSRNAELLALSGARSPYQGPLGMIAPGALADLLVFEGNPLHDINILADPERTLKLVMKDGVLHRNGLGAVSSDAA